MTNALYTMCNVLLRETIKAHGSLLQYVRALTGAGGDLHIVFWSCGSLSLYGSYSQKVGAQEKTEQESSSKRITNKCSALTGLTASQP